MLGIEKIDRDIIRINQDIISLSNNDRTFAQNLQAIANEVIRIQGVVQLTSPGVEVQNNAPEFMNPNFLNNVERIKQYFNVIYTMYNPDEVMPTLIQHSLAELSGDTSINSDITIQTTNDFKYIITDKECKNIILDNFYKYSLDKEKYEICGEIKKIKEVWGLE